MNDAPTYRIVTGPEAYQVVTRMVSPGHEPAGAAPAVAAFRAFLTRYGIDASRQAVAEVNGRLVGYCLCLVNPGRTAAVFLPERFPEPDSPLDFAAVASGVLRCLADQLEIWDLAMLQAMAPDEHSVPAVVFRKAGFRPLCRLNIMEAAVTDMPAVPAGAPAEWVSFADSRAERFGALILRSYEGSLDCPQLTGLRTGEEVLAGHRHSGIFEPDAWGLLRYRHEDAGVLLLNGTEEDPLRLEVVYMALVPAARGAGLGEVLVRRAFDLARARGKKTLRLAVDDANAPAVKLYHRFGFETKDRQTVYAVLNEARREKLKRL